MTTFTCPECRKLLKTAQEVAPGTAVSCPRCSAVFLASEAAGAVPPPVARRTAASPPPELRSRPPADDDWPDDPEPFGRMRRRRSNQGVLISLAVVSSLVAVIATVVLVLLLSGSRGGAGQLVGRWELIEDNGRRPDFRETVEFHQDGTGRLFGLHDGNRGGPPMNDRFDYRVREGNVLEVDVRRGPRRTFRMRFIGNDELELIEIEGMGDISRYR